MADDQPPEHDPFQFLNAVSLSSQDFAQRLVRSGLVDKDAVQRIWKELPDTERSTSGLAKALTVSAKLTPFQIRRVADEADPLLIIGGYVIQDKLGEGGMGQVYRALHRKMKREVALKVISSRLLKDTHTIARFNREVEAAAKLSHPNIISSFDAGESEGIHYLVMEYIVGTDLTSRVRQGGVMSIGEAVQVTMQAARGLAYAHAQGIVHRDIKPSNLLIDREGIVRVLDLGLARIEQADDASVMDGLTKTGSVMGTVDYMAPEQAMDSKTADARSDIYSLGCTLFFLITANSVFDGDTIVKRLLAHRSMPVPTLSKYNRHATPRLDAIFNRMLAKEPESRYQSMLEVVRELEAVLPELTDNGAQQVLKNNPTFEGTMPSGPMDETFDQAAPVVAASALGIQIEPAPKRVDRSPRSRKPSVESLSLMAAGAVAMLGIFGFVAYKLSANNPTVAKNLAVAAQPAERNRVAVEETAADRTSGSDLTGDATTPSTVVVPMDRDAADSGNVSGSSAFDHEAERNAAEWFASELVSGYVRLRLPDDALVELTPEQRALPSTPFVVEAIHFVDGQIDDAGLGHLKACRFLKELNLSRSIFPSEFADGVWLSQATQLESLDLSGTNVRDDALVAIADQCPNLKRLDLTQAADQTFRSLAVVSSLPSLNQLGCASDQLTSEAVAILVQHPNVTSLEIRGPITDATLRNIAPLGGQLTALVADVNVASESPLSLDAYRQLTAFEKLEEFTFRGIQSSPRDLDLQAIAALPQLRRVSLRFDAAVQADVAGSGRRYTDEGLAAFRKLRPDVELSADEVAFPATAAFGSVEIPPIPEMPVAVPEPKILDEPSTLASPEIRLAGLDQPLPAGYQPTLKMGDPLGAFATVASPSRINGLLSWSVEPIRHRGGATCIDASRDGLVASGGTDSTVRLWTADGKLIRVLTGHINEVASVAFSPDGKWLASVSVSPYSLLVIWDVASGNQLRALPTSNSYGRLEWSRDGTRLTHAASDVLEVYESSNWTRRQSERYLTPSQAAWSPDGQQLFLVCRGDPSGYLFDANTLKGISKHLVGGSLRSVSWSPDGQFIAVAGSNGVFAKPAQSLNDNHVMQYTRMYGVDFSPDGTVLAMGGDDGMKLFSTSDWLEIEIGHLSTGDDVCWSPEGDRILSLSDWYEPATETRIVSSMRSGTHPVGLAVAPDGLRLASRSPTRLRIWDGNTGDLLLEKASAEQVDALPPGGKPNDTDASPATQPASAMPSEQGTAEVMVSQLGWQPKGKLIFQVNPPNRPRSDHLELIDSEIGETTQTLKGHTGTIWSAAWSPDGKRLASVSEDGTCRLWSVRSGDSTKTLTRGSPLWWVVWSPDGTRLATGSASSEITVWDSKQGRPLQAFKTLSKELVEPSSKQYSDDAPFAFTRDASQILVVGSDSSFDLLNVSLGTTNSLGKVTLGGREGGTPHGIHWTNDYNSIGLVTSDRELNLYTIGVPQGNSIFRFMSPHWLEDGRRVVGGDHYHTNVVGIDLRQNRRLGTLLPELGDDAWAAVSADGHVRGSKGLANHVAMVVVLTNGRSVTMTPQEFAARFKWKNDSSKVRLLR